jgi:flavin reductase (DIM6/NTAB) family NADH-FMN oxidoreductase RutF
LTQPDAVADSPHDFELATGAFASGVTLVTIADGREDVGVTVSAFCALSTSPPLIMISLINGSYPADLLGRLDRFALTVLAAGQRMLAGRFAATGRPGARHLLDDIPHHRGAASGALIADDGLAAMECEVTSRVPAGDHLLVIARVLAVDKVASSGLPLIRFHRRYASLDSE